MRGCGALDLRGSMEMDGSAGVAELVMERRLGWGHESEVSSERKWGVYVQEHKYIVYTCVPFRPIYFRSLRIVDQAGSMQCNLCDVHISHRPFLRRLFIALHLVARLEPRPVLKAHAALGSFSYLCDVFLDVLEGGKRAWDQISTSVMIQGP